MLLLFKYGNKIMVIKDWLIKMNIGFQTVNDSKDFKRFIHLGKTYEYIQGLAAANSVCSSPAV